MGDGIENEDRPEGIIESILLEGVQKVDPTALFPTFLETGKGNGKQDRFQKRAEEGYRQSQKDDDQQIGHRTPKSSTKAYIGYPEPRKEGPEPNKHTLSESQGLICTLHFIKHVSPFLRVGATCVRMRAGLQQHRAMEMPGMKQHRV